VQHQDGSLPSGASTAASNAPRGAPVPASRLSRTRLARVADAGYGAIALSLIAMHIDGQTNTKGDADHKPEPFPHAAMPAGHGLTLTKPDEAGNWKMRAFAFEPSQLIVNAGDKVRLHFVGVQGMSHSIHLEGADVDERFTVKRGYIHTVDFTPKTAGIIEIECYDHEPSMRGEIVVLPR
jgi:plastocyanin